MTPVTAKDLVNAVKNKYIDAAVLPEVSILDSAAELLRYSAYAQAEPRNIPLYDKHKIAYDLSLPIPSGYNPGAATTVRRIDALIFETNQRTAVEIKISRADFFRDTLEKRSAWMNHTHRFVYVTPKGLVKVEEVPDKCGLWEYDPATRKLTVVKKAVINKNALDLPADMSKYFAWRAFLAERQLQQLKAKIARQKP